VHRHFIIHKPYGYLSQFINNKRRKKKLLGDLQDFPEGTMAIGRLDVKSEGLLLLTTDGKLSAQIRSQKFEKEYLVQVDGIVQENELVPLREGILLKIEGKKHQSLPAKAEIIEPPIHLPLQNRKVREARHGPTSWLSITLKEGKFRQVRKMTAAIGHPTHRLIRCRIGQLELNDLAPGKVIEVDQLEV
jgi:23S rRNA pseudouridine2457 synthase